MVRRRATSKDVAERAGVSRTTVSFVLNNTPNVKISEETRQRVLAAARELDYHPDAAARSLASRRTGNIGLVLRQSPAQVFADAFLPTVLRGLSAVLDNSGYRILLQPLAVPGVSNALVTLVKSQHIDGLIVSGPRSDDDGVRDLHASNFPIVLMGHLPDSDIPFVDVDNERGSFDATKHLLSLGHHRIAMITNGPLAYTASQERLAGYRRALESTGLPFDSSLVRYGDFREESGFTAMLELLDLTPRPTAVFAASDVLAFGVLEAAKSVGLGVPDDLSVVGMDNVRLARYVVPPLTTLHLPAYELGYQAANTLLRLIDGQQPPSALLPTELVIRESSAPPPGPKQGG
ncbi:MAG: LacI family transcriptional regulator [Ardenticatenaceae bacterium]|nr:LacI family transcriptional regulator [Ardenticatenaceae bacterium]